MVHDQHPPCTPIDGQSSLSLNNHPHRLYPESGQMRRGRWSQNPTRTGLSVTWSRDEKERPEQSEVEGKGNNDPLATVAWEGRQANERLASDPPRGCAATVAPRPSRERIDPVVGPPGRYAGVPEIISQPARAL